MSNIQGQPGYADGVSPMTELLNKKARVDEIEKTLHNLPDPHWAKISKDFLKDRISDTNGFSFHRIQILAWTIVLAFIFIKG